MYYIILKFLSREPKKTMNFIRDIAIPVILILSIGAMIISVNNQLTNLITLGGQNDVLIVRNTQTSIENSTIPSGMLENKSLTNIDKIVPVIYQTIPVIIKNNQTEIYTPIQFVLVNISQLNSILPFRTLQNSQIAEINNNETIIGSHIVDKLFLNKEALSNYHIFFPETNKSQMIGPMISLPDIFVNAIVMNIDNANIINKTYNYQYYSELLIKIRDRSKIVSTASQIQNIIARNYSNCNCEVLQGSGTNSLLRNVISTIIEQLSLFNFILDIIIIIRIIQSLFWIAQEYQYELNELKILGATTTQIFGMFIFLSMLVGNLGYLLGIIGSVLFPICITYIVGIFTFQTVTIIPPTLDQIIVNFFQINLIIILVTLFPAFQLSRKKLLKQKERE